MHQHTNHDTSTQAMTEIALGLCMAFFSLLILALFSIGLPKQIQSNEAATNTQSSLSNQEQLQLVGNKGKNASGNPPESKKQQYVFYFNGAFYDKQPKRLTINHLSQFETEQPLILAVQDNLPLLQVMAVRKQINHPNLSITMLDQKWKNQLEKM